MLFQRLSLFFALAALAVLMSVQARPLPEKSAIVRQDTYLVKRSNENAEVDDSDPDDSLRANVFIFNRSEDDTV